MVEEEEKAVEGEEKEEEEEEEEAKGGVKIGQSPSSCLSEATKNSPFLEIWCHFQVDVFVGVTLLWVLGFVVVLASRYCGRRCRCSY